jgi:metallo-beta-lactamase class B
VLHRHEATQMPKLIERPWRLVLLVGAAALVVMLGLQWRAAIGGNRASSNAPFQIAGNLYSVGSFDVTSFLLTGPEGHVLIDGGYAETAPLIIENIAELGFDIADVKVLLNSHAHFDHAGGLAALQDASGAELWISEGDAEAVAAGGADDPTIGPARDLGLGTFPAPHINHRFEDGATIRLGPLALTGHVTGGHTRGCTSWSFPVQGGERELLAVSICSLSVLPGVSLVEPETYPGIRGDFERSFTKLRSLSADIFLGSHGSFFAVERKLRERVASGDRGKPFVDRAGYQRFIDEAEARFRERLAEQQGE